MLLHKRVKVDNGAHKGFWSRVLLADAPRLGSMRPVIASPSAQVELSVCLQANFRAHQVEAGICEVGGV